ncbi:Nsi1 protein [Martiniozyma asiatica (nom. inval.)]|nr:Nsi1 protein [Martiniozyma asiatica]
MSSTDDPHQQLDVSDVVNLDNLDDDNKTDKNLNEQVNEILKNHQMNSETDRLSHLSNVNLPPLSSLNLPSTSYKSNLKLKGKKRQLSALDDDEEFQQWTSGILTDTIGSSNGDLDVTYNFDEPEDYQKKRKINDPLSYLALLKHSSGLVDPNSEDAQNLAVEAVSQAANQAVAAVRAAHGDINVDGVSRIEDSVDSVTADIAAAVAAATSSNDLISSNGFSSFSKDLIKKTDRQLYELIQNAIKNDSKLSLIQKPSKKIAVKRKNIITEDMLDPIWDRRLKEAINKAREPLIDQPIQGTGFTKEEKMAIDIWVEEYRRMEGISHQEFLERIWSNDRKRDKFWESLKKVLPNRERSSLYKHVRRTYHVFEKRGVWSEEEDAKLASLANEFEGKWKYIGEQLLRMPEDCRDRWRNYIKCGQKRNTNKWSEEEEEKLKLIISTLLSEEGKEEEESLQQNEEVKDKSPKGKSINWTRVSELMDGTRSRIQCRYKWNKIMKRESIQKVKMMSTNTKIWLFQNLRHRIKNGETANSINWDDIAIELPNDAVDIDFKWTGSDFSLCYQKMKNTVDSQSKDFGEIVELLIDNLTPEKYAEKLEKLVDGNILTEEEPYFKYESKKVNPGT